MYTKLLARFGRQSKLDTRSRVEDILGVDLSSVPDRNVELTAILSLAFHSYVPGKYHGNLTVFRARHRTLNEVVFGSLDPRMGWSNFTTGEIYVKMVDGFHRNIHLPPYADSLASELRYCIEMESPNAQQNDL